MELFGIKFNEKECSRSVPTVGMSPSMNQNWVIFNGKRSCVRSDGGK